MLSETPMGLLHRSLIARPDETAHPSQQVARVRMLRDAWGQTFHPGPMPKIIAAKAGESLEVSGDLALLWFASETAVPDDGSEEKTVEIIAEQVETSLAPEAAAMKEAVTLATKEPSAEPQKKKAARKKGKPGDRFARKDPHGKGS